MRLLEFILDHWYGRLSVPQSVWLSGIAALLVCLPFGMLDLNGFFSANHITSLGAMGDRMMDGSLTTFAQSPFLLQSLDQFFNVVTLVWWSVGTWRACDNPDNNHPAGKKYWWLKFTIILTAAFEFYDLADFVRGLLGK